MTTKEKIINKWKTYNSWEEELLKKLQYIRDAGFEINDIESFDMLRRFFDQIRQETIEEVLNRYNEIMELWRGYQGNKTLGEFFKEKLLTLKGE
ncbi:MAG: hypothetical protein AABY22_02745 [Nanoarchaeota archaeon]